MCLYPKLIKNPKYKSSKKRGYYVPKNYDKRTEYVPVACGKCFECRKKRAREWRIRLAEELRHDSAYFVTLTINEQELEKLRKEVNAKEIKGSENDIAKYALRHALERIRKKTKKSVKHWFITELGETNGRIHLHGITFGKGSAEKFIENWKYGFTFIGNYVSERTINYITKYVLKDDINNRHFTGKILTSQGIGAKYFEREDWKNCKYKENGETNEMYRFRNGTKCALPRYYKEKIYSENEREKLWLEKIEKGDTWVMGEKCKIDSNEYKNLLNFYRNRAIQVHGDNQILWNEKKYYKRLEAQRNALAKRKNPRMFTKKNYEVETEQFILENCPF